MNDTRRKALEIILEQIGEKAEALAAIMEEEQESRDNMTLCSRRV